MALETLFAQIMKVPVESISAETSPQNLINWDSLRHLELIESLELKLGVQFSMDEVLEITSFGVLKDMVERKSLGATR